MNPRHRLLILPAILSLAAHGASGFAPTGSPAPAKKDGGRP
jgi:hypothetical protein